MLHAACGMCATGLLLGGSPKALTGQLFTLPPARLVFVFFLFAALVLFCFFGFGWYWKSDGSLDNVSVARLTFQAL